VFRYADICYLFAPEFGLFGAGLKISLKPKIKNHPVIFVKILSEDNEKSASPFGKPNISPTTLTGRLFQSLSIISLDCFHLREKNVG
jgi:hypothetical protein